MNTPLQISDRDNVIARHCHPIGTDTQIARRILIQGRVQGLGVRPSIARLANTLALAGSVRNSNQGVETLVEGFERDVQRFLQRLADSLPAGVSIEQILVEASEPRGLPDFSIEPSTLAARRTVRIPPDVAACGECLSEVSAFDNRRHGYVLTTCTCCGPRYTLIDYMPYDRAATAMARYQLCAKCRQEYLDPENRRFHSQTNCCEQCGPQLWLSDAGGRVLGAGEVALQSTIESLRKGEIIAIRGIGGYQLLADASAQQAVDELRRRKQRHGKPLAVMVADAVAADSMATMTVDERRVLRDPTNSIVVTRAKASSCLADNVARGLDTIGMMLPTSPLHDRLIRRFGGPLVVTSGNLEGRPLIFDQREAQHELGQVADYLLHHDRPIVRPIDDSVVRVVGGRVATMRLGRGLAPLSLPLRCELPIVALGGHQKAALALSNGDQAVLGPHVGDLDDEATRVRFVEHFESMCRLYEVEPALVVHDEHPDYFTTRWAAQRQVARMSVQHHHAHVAAGMLEHNLLGQTVLGVAWDGTGYGPDATVWGGEFLLATASYFRRVGCLRPFALPGGDAAVRQPWRVALALVQQSFGVEKAASLALANVSPADRQFIATALGRQHRWPQATSAGRLFDGVAALVLGVTHAEFEAQGAMLLEAACEPNAPGTYPLPLKSGEPSELDWRPLVAGVLEDLECGRDVGTIAMRFHRSLAGGIAEMVRQFGTLPIVLCGGCFYNRVLTELVADALDGSVATIALPGQIPTGDGGLAAGQLAVAAARIAEGWQPCA